MREVSEQTYATESMVASLFFGVFIAQLAFTQPGGRAFSTLAALFVALVAAYLINRWRKQFPDDEIIEIGGEAE